MQVGQLDQEFSLRCQNQPATVWFVWFESSPFSCFCVILSLVRC